MSRHGKHIIKSKLIAQASAIALLAAGLSVAAHAQSEAQPIAFDLPEQSLETALRSYSVATDAQVLFATDIVAGKQSPAVTGDMTPMAALDALLVGSGLTYELTASNVILIRTAGSGAASRSEAAAVRTEASNSAASQAVAVASAAQASQPMGPTGEAGEPGIVRGVVRAAGADAGLDGALIRIEETGQTTFTDNLGRFRFASVPAGRYTVTVSYLGFAEVSEAVELEAGGDVTLPFQLSSNVSDVILVRGYRSSRAQSLNQERTADNVSTVLAADLLGNFTGDTISEALRRASGVAFEQSLETGEGTNVIIRGLAPDLNQVTLNGVRLAERSGQGRSPDLSGILTESVESVTINKTLLPSQDSTGTGGLIEIETRSPLDRGARFASFSADRTERGAGFGYDRNISGTVSSVFGQSESFGISLSAQYREQDITRIGTTSNLNFGQYLPADVTSPFSIDPGRLFPFEDGVVEAYPTGANASSDRNISDNLTLNLTIEKQIGDHTNLRLDLTRSEVSQSDLARSSNAGAAGAGNYSLQPIDELGGEVRFALVSERPAGGFLPGVRPFASQSVTYAPDRERVSEVISFRGQSEVDAWTFDYNIGYSNAESDGTNYQLGTTTRRAFVFADRDISDVLRPEIRNNTVNGLVVSFFEPILPGEDPGFIFPGITESLQAQLNDPANIVPSGLFFVGRGSGRNERYTFSGSSRRTFGAAHLRYVEVGISFEESTFKVTPPTENTLYAEAGTQTPISAFGLEYEPGVLSLVGGPTQGFNVITRDSLDALISNFSSLVSSGLLLDLTSPVRPEQRETFTEETNIAGYIQTQIDFNRFEFIGGVRIDHVETNAAIVSSPSFTGVDEAGLPVQFPNYSSENLQLFNVTGESTEVLPRALLNYRRSDNSIARLGYFVSVARPTVSNLNRNQSLSLNLVPDFGPNADQPLLSVFQGNPDLESTYTHNFDFSAEHYFDDAGVFKFGLFYKLIQNPLETSETVGGLELDVSELQIPSLPEFQNLPANLFIQVRQPINDENDAHIWGIELTAERNLTFLPGPLRDLGIFANYTYTDSSRTRRFTTTAVPEGFIELDGLAFDGSPPHSGTFAVNYNAYGIDASLAYTYQDRRISETRLFGLDRYFDEADSLDFSLAYTREVGGSTLRAFFEAADMLEGTSDFSVSQSYGGERDVPLYQGASRRYFGGRSFVFGLSATF